MQFLVGKKTYILVAIGVIVWGAEAMGLVEQGTANKLDALLVVLGLGTIRSAISNK